MTTQQVAGMKLLYPQGTQVDITLGSSFPPITHTHTKFVHLTWLIDDLGLICVTYAMIQTSELMRGCHDFAPPEVSPEALMYV